MMMEQQYIANEMKKILSSHHFQTSVKGESPMIKKDSSQMKKEKKKEER